MSRHCPRRPELHTLISHAATLRRNGPAIALTSATVGLHSMDPCERLAVARNAAVVFLCEENQIPINERVRHTRRGGCVVYQSVLKGNPVELFVLSCVDRALS